ncbi:MAG: PilZ domain-containing protein, partial [Candidatus Omnitrophica bacterium]|nr:PilZ domain-containing protein [Candidatus Omnitrophota bacterium]
HILLPSVQEKQSAHFCEIVRNRIKEYFASHRKEDVFINVGVASYPYKNQTSTTNHILANLYLKIMYIGSEIRRFPRISHQMDIEVLFPDKKQENSQTIDISEGGLCFSSTRPLATDTKISLYLTLPRTKNTLHLRGRAAWLKPVNEEYSQKIRSYLIGIEFSGIKESERKILRKFLRTRQK